jgi:pyridoxal phosphate enzyme (YggS family)
MSFADNLRRVRERITQAAEAAGRRADDVTLVAVTKYVDAIATAEAIAAGCRDLGESRPQELWAKSATLNSRLGEPASAGGVRWHLIGHLQRNKVRRTLPLVALIHSVDSERLLAAINSDAQSLGIDTVRVLLEVNTSGDSAKHGLAPDEVEPLIANSTQFSRVAICGLMTMAALEGGPTVARRNFAALRELRDRLAPRVPAGVELTELSMGMSGDFEEAIREGATIVRVGSALWEI